MCAYADHAFMFGKEDPRIYAFIHEVKTNLLAKINCPRPRRLRPRPGPTPPACPGSAPRGFVPLFVPFRCLSAVSSCGRGFAARTATSRARARARAGPRVPVHPGAGRPRPGPPDVPPMRVRRPPPCACASRSGG